MIITEESDFEFMERKKMVAIFGDAIIICYSHALNSILETRKNVHSSESASFTTREYFMNWETVIECAQLNHNLMSLRNIYLG